MSEHVHTCVGCVPDMVPEFDPDDSRYVTAASKVDYARWRQVVIDGDDTRKVCEAVAGAQGWARIYQLDEEGRKHGCPCGGREVCCTVLRGSVVLQRRGEVPA